MKTGITVKELREQLEKLEKMGMGDAQIWYRDPYSFDYPLEQGLWDNNDKNVVLA